MAYLDSETTSGDCREELKDEEILARSVAEPRLFVLLVHKYEEAFLRKARSILRSEDEAIDTVQETFTKMYLNAAKFKTVEGATLSSWGYRILINTALTKYARRKREMGERADLDEEIWQLIPDRNLRQFEKLSLQDEVASVLCRIPEPLARVLRRFFIDGKSQEEMAREEGVSVGAIKSRVHRAKAEFRKVYKTFNQNAPL